MEYATTAIRYLAESGTYEVFIENSTIRHNSEDGINLFFSGNANIYAVIENNLITDNGAIGVSCQANSNRTVANLRICGNTITNNGDSGVFCFANAGASGLVFDAAICNNTIQAHPKYGIYCHTYYSQSKFSIDHNNIDRSGTGIFAYYRRNLWFKQFYVERQQQHPFCTKVRDKYLC